MTTQRLPFDERISRERGDSKLGTLGHHILLISRNGYAPTTEPVTG